MTIIHQLHQTQQTFSTGFVPYVEPPADYLFNVFWMNDDKEEWEDSEEVDLVVRAESEEKALQKAKETLPHLDSSHWGATLIEFNEKGIYIL